MGTRSSWVLFSVALAMAMMVPVAGPAGASPTNSCAAPGGIGMFPNTPGSSSQLKVACTLDTATGSTDTFYKIEDFPEAVWHFGAAWRTAANVTFAAGATTLNSAGGHFSAAADTNHGIAGPGIATGTFIKTVNSATQIVISAATTAAKTNDSLLVENSDGRSVGDGATTLGSKTVTSPTAHFCRPALATCGPIANDQTRSISGTDIPHGATISVVNSTTSVTISLAATATNTCSGPTPVCEQLTIGASPSTTTAREVNDAHITSGMTTLTSATANFLATDVNLPVVGPGIPANDFIKTVTNPTTVTLNTAATVTSTTAVIDVGFANAAAPANGEAALTLGSELDINSTLVTGDDPCSKNTAEGSNLSGKWFNPGSFLAASFGSTTDPALKAPRIAQLAFPTSLITFAGYVEQLKASTAGELQTAAHYDIVFPLLPSGIAVCPAPNAVGLATTFQYAGTSLLQGFLPSGTGTPGTSTIRSLKDFPPGTTTKTTFAYVHIQKSSTNATGAFNASATCKEDYPDPADFGCGTG